MIIALWANLKVCFQIFSIDCRITLVALDPQIAWDVKTLAGVISFFLEFFSFEPIVDTQSCLLYYNILCYDVNSLTLKQQVRILENTGKGVGPMAEKARKEKKRKKLRDLRKARKHQARNLKEKKALKAALKVARSAIAAKAADCEEKIRKAASVIDKAAERGLIHARKAARLKSRLMQAHNKIVTQT